MGLVLGPLLLFFELSALSLHAFLLFVLLVLLCSPRQYTSSAARSALTVERIHIVAPFFFLL